MTGFSKTHSDSLEVIKLNKCPDQVFGLSEIIEHQSLSFNAIRTIAILWRTACWQGSEKDKDYTVNISDLCPPGPEGREALEEAIVSLMQTLITIKHLDGRTTRVQLLGGNTIDRPDHPSGTFTYNLDKRLFEVLQNSKAWDKISLPTLTPISPK